MKHMKRRLLVLAAIALVSSCTKTDRGPSCVPAWNEAECRICCEGMGLEFSEFFMIEIDRGECFCKEEGEE
jgi:hypothetical protein